MFQQMREQSGIFSSVAAFAGPARVVVGGLGQASLAVAFFVSKSAAARAVASFDVDASSVARKKYSSGCEEFGVEKVGRALTLKEGGDILGGGERHLAAGFDGGRAEMRSENHVGTFETGVNKGFLFEDIEAGAGNFLGFESVDKGGFIHHRAAGSVDEERGRLHSEEFWRVEELASVAIEGNVE